MEKRFTKEQIKEYIKKKMDRVKRDLDGTVKHIQAEGRSLQDNIDTTSRTMKD